jgi:hypothetical protein
MELRRVDASPFDIVPYERPRGRKTALVRRGVDIY